MRNISHYELWREADGECRFVFKAFGIAARTLASARPTIIVIHPVDIG